MKDKIIFGHYYKFCGGAGTVYNKKTALVVQINASLMGATYDIKFDDGTIFTSIPGEQLKSKDEFDDTNDGLNEDDLDFIHDVLDHESFDYAFYRYSAYKEIKNKKFHDLREAYLKARKELTEFIDWED
jgi:hypothetical protein